MSHTSLYDHFKLIEGAVSWNQQEMNIGSARVVLLETAPQWLKDAVQKAHRGALPNNWVYAECRAACLALDEQLEDMDAAFNNRKAILENDWSDWSHEHANQREEVRTQPLFQWASKMCLTLLFSEAESNSHGGGEGPGDTVARRLGMIYFCAVRIIADTITTEYVHQQVGDNK